MIKIILLSAALLVIFILCIVLYPIVLIISFFINIFNYLFNGNIKQIATVLFLQKTERLIISLLDTIEDEVEKKKRKI